MALLGAAHPGPAFAVTLLAGLLAGAVGLGPGRIALVVAAVLTGQLSIGWSNDLIDLARDRAVGRTDKPLVDGRVLRADRPHRVRPRGRRDRPALARVRLAWPVSSTWSASRRAGPTTSALKSTPWSWLPYAVAFGALPAFVSLTDNPDQVPPLWLPLAGALLGVGAHFVNVLPDLADDAATGVRGLPHRLGARRSQAVAAAVLVAAAVVIVVGAPVDSAVVAVVALVVDGGSGRRRAVRTRPGAVPGRDRHGAGGRGHAGLGPMTRRRTPTDWDVVVVGAGPAGATAALSVLHADPALRVLLLDRSDFPRDKSCGDGIAPHSSSGWPRSASPASRTAGPR